MCVRNSVSVSTTIQLEFGTFATAWYLFYGFSFYYLLAQENPTMFVMCLMVTDGQRSVTKKPQQVWMVCTLIYLYFICKTVDTVFYSGIYRINNDLIV